jgi:hypothetical protein
MADWDNWRPSRVDHVDSNIIAMPKGTEYEFVEMRDNLSVYLWEVNVGVLKKLRHCPVINSALYGLFLNVITFMLLTKITDVYIIINNNYVEVSHCAMNIWYSVEAFRWGVPQSLLWERSYMQPTCESKDKSGTLSHFAHIINCKCITKFSMVTNESRKSSKFF